MSLLRQQLSSLKTAAYRRPKDELQRLLRWGPRAYFGIEAWMREMEEAAGTLPRIEIGKAESGNPVEVWFLTGRRFWYQTAFCAWTLAAKSGRCLELNLIDDGSLEEQHVEALRRLFPSGTTTTKESVRTRIDSLLPASRFPILRQRWIDYINIRKMTDIHIGSSGVKLVLDSDMLFFRRPAALLQWWDDHQDASSGSFSPCLMTDCVESYGYSRPLMERLAGAPIPPLLNVGICGLMSEELDWEEIEYWCRTLLEAEGTNYYLEQALVAMLAARHAPTVMPRADYITFPTRDQVGTGGGVLQHYVADSKPWYFGMGWKHPLIENGHPS